MKAVYRGRRTCKRSPFGNYRWIPWAIGACFVVVVVANGGLVYYALASWPGLTTDHAYSDGLAYNRVIDESEKEAKLGWSLTVDFVSDRKGTSSGRLVVQAKDKAGAPIDGLSLQAELVRPVEAMREIPLAFEAKEGGRYAASLTLPRAGQWDVYLVARLGQVVYHTGRRILVP
jgi:nitrogen fixation protein FixH